MIERITIAALAIFFLGACHDNGRDPALSGPVDLAASALACEADLSCPGGGICDPRSLRCVECVEDVDCAPGHCDLARHACVQCLADTDCASGRCHPSLAVCVECASDAECGGGLCDPRTFACVGCLPELPDICGSGACDPASLTCVGGCLNDAQCDDGEACTVDRCDPGEGGLGCVHDPISDGACCTPAACGAGASAFDADGDRCRESCRCNDGTLVDVGAVCCAPFTCADLGHPIDTNADGCADACDLCEPPTCFDGARPTDEDADGCPDTCPACPSPVCIDGQPVDTNHDGCAESCVCPTGALAGPDGRCACPSKVTCADGLVGSDLDGDGCADRCTRPCESSCDCVGQGIVSEVPCPLSCETCGPWLACQNHVCVGQCDVVPPSATSCGCPAPPVCGPGELAIDSDGDTCGDTCACAEGRAGPNCACSTIVACAAGASPVDLNGDTCADACRCDDPSAVLRADGTCCAPPAADCACPAVACDAPAVAIDADRNGCPDGCAVPCADDCDCAASAAIAAGLDGCQDGCPTCTIRGSCEAGVCGFQCELPAICTVAPAEPPEVVCGCNQTTYVDRCAASDAGTGVERVGDCSAGRCTVGSGVGCAAGTACEDDSEGCGPSAPSAGHCVAQPAVCPAVLDPVCGCDGVDYASDCARRAAGARRAHRGFCL